MQVYRGVLRRRARRRKLQRLTGDKTATDSSSSSIDKPPEEEVVVEDQLKCPNGIHTNRKRPCRCVHLERFPSYVEEEVLDSWHLDEELKLSEYEISQPPTAVQGGQGIVFYTQQLEHPETRFAMKFKNRMELRGPTWTFEKREIDILKTVRHPFIVKMFHWYETESGLFMALEFLDGGSMWRLIYESGPLPEKPAAYYSACVVDALDFLHAENFMYRDLKAENVVLDARGGLRLIDFGLSKKTMAEGETLNLTRYDFVSYLAPEIYTDPASSTLKVDSWGVGFFLTELLLGYGILRGIPWEAEEQSAHLSQDWKHEFAEMEVELLSEICRNFIAKLLARNPTDRPTMAEAKLDPFFTGVDWPKLAVAIPPADPHANEDVVYCLPKEPEPTPEEPEEEVEQYQPVPNVPTVRLPIRQRPPDPKIDMQLVHRFKTALGLQKSTTRKVEPVVRVMGNL